MESSFHATIIIVIIIGMMGLWWVRSHWWGERMSMWRRTRRRLKRIYRWKAIPCTRRRIITITTSSSLIIDKPSPPPSATPTTTTHPNTYHNWSTNPSATRSTRRAPRSSSSTSVNSPTTALPIASWTNTCVRRNDHTHHQWERSCIRRRRRRWMLWGRRRSRWIIIIGIIRRWSWYMIPCSTATMITKPIPTMSSRIDNRSC